MSVGDTTPCKRSARQIGILVLILALSACGGAKPLQIELMPAPEVYDENFNPFTDSRSIDDLPYQGVLYATDRMPATEDSKERFYLNDRGGYLRLGLAKVKLARADMTWEDARRLSLAKNRSDKYPIEVSDVEEFGGLDRSWVPFLPLDKIGTYPHSADAEFADVVNSRLATSKRKDIYIYVHGYKVIFENPVLVATELWHFLGYDGVFIAYSWPSTPSKWAYLKDTETAAGFARNLRIFIEYLAEETDVEQIHVVGYSAGTRLVSRTFEQLALMHHDSSPEKIRDELRIGNLILIGSDVDRQVFGTYVADGLLEIPRHLSIYVSERDKALGFSTFLTRRERLGQMWTELPESLSAYFDEHEADVSIINVTDAEGGTGGNGHGYFRQSPWASSDILMTLMYDLPPATRGLVRNEETSIWTFPPDYIQRLRTALGEINPQLKFTAD
jgi:esterase/lipase superfamily enzyme